MANIITFNQQKLLQLREQGKNSFYFFQRGLLGDRDLTPELHLPLCNMLQADNWRRMMLIGFRGCLKTSTLRAWVLREGLYSLEPGPDGVPVAVEGFKPNYSSFWIEQKHENAEMHHGMLQAKFKLGPQAALLQDMFSDRIDGVFDRWTVKKTLLVQTDANAEAFVTIGSLDAKLEGGHKEDIVCDDLEGADADKSDVPNEESAKFIFDRAPHLLKIRYEGRILVGGTPHGPSPLAYKWKNLEADGSTDNSKRKRWKIWWMPAMDEDGNSHWEERYPTKELHIERVIAERAGGPMKRGWDTQMMLQRSMEGTQIFDMDRIHEGLYRTQHVKLDGKLRRLLLYEKHFFNQEALDKYGRPKFEIRPAQIDLAACRFFMHSDPAHKDKSELISNKTPSKWAIVVVAMAPDMHAFVVDCWIRRESNIDEYLEQWIYFYKYWAPKTAGSCTFDPVGAQTWIRNHLAMLERYKYPDMMSLPTPWRKKRVRLPKPSRMLVEARKANAGKIEHIMQQLQMPFNMGWLHLQANPQGGGIHKSQAELWRELELCGASSEESFDGIDALSQGPDVWEPPPGPEAIKAKLMRIKILKLMRLTEDSIYSRPWPDEEESRVLAQHASQS